MCEILKTEFRMKNVWFGHHRPEDFYSAQWRWHPSIYITYRLVIASYSIASFLAFMIPDGSGRSFAYLTILTFTLLCLYQISALFTAIFGYLCRRATSLTSNGATLIKANTTLNKCVDTALPNPVFTSDGGNKLTSEKGQDVSNGFTSQQTNISIKEDNENQTQDNTDRTTWYMKLTWLLGSIFYTFGIIVTIVYFAAVHQGGTSYHDLNMHAFNTVQIIIDIAIVARPIRFLHVVYPFLYGLCYIIFSVIFWSQDKVNNVLYANVLDWNKPGTTAIVVVVLALVGIPFLHFVLYGIYRLRLYAFKQCNGIDDLD